MKFVLILFFISISFCNLAQNQEQKMAPMLVGNVVDITNQLPIEFAAIALLNISDSSIISGTITDKDGNFLMKDLQVGNYILKITFVGYKNYVSEIFIVESPLFNKVGTIGLEQGENLETVIIEEEKSYFESSIDKKIYRVDRDIVASSGNGSDVLQTIPSVTIDIDGNISLRGNTGVRIWIDGKPTGITGSSLNAILEQIPASNIESVEVVTNPSAKYEAEGSAGIINIVMKKNKQVGLNGNISAGISTSPKYDGSFSLNYRNAKLNAYSNFSIAKDARESFANSFRKTFFEDTIFYQISESNGENIGTMQMGRAGIDFFLNEKNTLGFSGMAHHGNGENLNTVNYQFLDLDSLLSSLSDRITQTESDYLSYSATATYKNIFVNPKNSISGDFTFSSALVDDSSSYNEQFYTTDFSILGFPILQNISRPGINNDLVGSLNYVYNFKNANLFESGFKYTKEFKDNTIKSESFDTISSSFIPDETISNQFIYNENVYAAYAIWNSSIKKFGYQIGIRAEQTILLSELVTTNEEFKQNYFGLFPSAHLAYKFSDKTELTASYSRRIDRPNPMFLNPFPDYSDPYSLRFGNPFLEPEYENNIELGFTQFLNKHSIDFSIFYSQTLNEISPYIIVDSNGISKMTFQNYNSESQLGTELILRSEFFKWWNATGSFNFNRTIVDAQNLEIGLTNSVFNYNLRIMNFMQIYKQTSFQFTVSYSTPWTYAQGKSDPIFYVDAGIKSDFFKNKLTVNLTMSDVFDTREWGGYSKGVNYFNEYVRKRESQIASLKLTYKFGQQDAGKRKGSGQENYEGGNIEMF